MVQRMSLRPSSVLLRPLSREALRFLAHRVNKPVERKRGAARDVDTRATEARKILEARSAAVAAHAEPALC